MRSVFQLVSAFTSVQVLGNPVIATYGFRLEKFKYSVEKCGRHKRGEMLCSLKPSHILNQKNIMFKILLVGKRKNFGPKLLNSKDETI